MFHLGFWGLLFWMIVLHCWADYPGQGDYLAQSKNPNSPLGQNAVWKESLFAHSMIHAGCVALVTGSIFLGLLEAVVHAGPDYAKCQQRISLHTDQFIHRACKVVWAALAVTVIH